MQPVSVVTRRGAGGWAAAAAAAAAAEAIKGLLLLVRLAIEYLALEEATSEAAIAVTLGGFETDCETCSFDVNLVSAAAEAAADHARREVV